jgi:hypothetical protein
MSVMTECPDPVEVRTFGEAKPLLLCGCGVCPPPPRPCPACNDLDAHSAEPGVGCTRPGCLCLMPY